MAKKVLVVSQRFWPEHTKINDICKGLSERGLRVDVLCGKPNYPEGKFFPGYNTFGRRVEKYGSIRLFRTMEIRRDTGSAFRRMLNYLAFPLAGLFRVRALKKNRYDAVLVYQSSSVMADTAGCIIAKRLHIPLITYAVNIWPQSIYNELDIQNTLLKSFFARISRRHYLAADRIITECPQADSYFTGNLHIHPGKVFCIPPGQDIRFDNEDRDIQIMERFAGSFNLLIADELLDRQDYDTLFEAGKKILNAGINDIRIIAAGSGRNLAKLRKKADSLGLHDLVFFEEARSADDMPKYLFIADAYLSCLRTDVGSELAFPEMFADFMSKGKPMLVTTGSLEKHLIKTSGCGLTCDPEDPDGLFEMIMSLYKCPLEKLRRMGDLAKEYHQAHFDRENNIDQIYDVIFNSGEIADDGFILNQNTHIIRTEEDI